MEADNRRLNTIHQSLLRPILVMGAERRLVIPLWIIFFALLLPWKGWLAAGCAVLLAAVGQPVLIYLAKLDPLFGKARSAVQRGLYQAFPLSAAALSGANLDLVPAAIESPLP